MKRIIVVDDESDVLLAIRGVLEAAGFEVHDAGDGLTALRMIRDTPFDLVISDIVMPEMNGFDMVETMKKNAATRDIPVILLTRKDAFDDIHRGYELGVVNYLPKPFNGTMLLEAVHQFFGPE